MCDRLPSAGSDGSPVLLILDEREQGFLAETLVLSGSSTLQVELLRFGETRLPVDYQATYLGYWVDGML